MRPDDGVTEIGGPGRSFPDTLWGVVLGPRDPNGVPGPELERLLALYWKPIYWFIRTRWNRSNEDAKDLTQDFLCALLEGGALLGTDPAKGRFRSFVLASLENFLRNDHRKSRRRKRGGGLSIVSLDAAGDSGFDPPAAELPMEAAFDRLWAQSLVAGGLDILRRQYDEAGRERVFEIFEAHDLADRDPPSYAELAVRFGVTEHSVRHALRRVRADLRAFLRDRVRATLADPSLLDEEMRHLFGNES